VPWGKVLSLGFGVVDFEYVFFRAFFDGEGEAAATDSVPLGRGRSDLRCRSPYSAVS
jgi:hypothetical protein